MKITVVCLSVLLFCAGGCYCPRCNRETLSEGSVDLPNITIRTKPGFTDDRTNGSVKNLCFEVREEMIEVAWGGEGTQTPLTLDPEQVYTFEIGAREITDSDEVIPGEIFYAVTKHYYLRKVWKGKELLLYNRDQENLRGETCLGARLDGAVSMTH